MVEACPLAPMMGDSAEHDDVAASDDRDGAATVDVPPRSAPVPTAIGSRVGRYVVIDEIGAGGMGRVVRAYDPQLEREVALKELRKAQLGDEGARRLVREARAMAKLSHPNVVAIYDVETLATDGDDDHIVLVMEYVAGGTLRGWRGDHAQGWAEIVRRYVAAGRGLAAAHVVGLVHRDFKPANVLVGADGTIKVADFGLAKGVGEPLSDAGSSASDPEQDSVTQSGMVMGTPRYMAPEQYVDAGAEPGPAVDQYAFCVALWEALHAAAPFSGKHALEAKRRGPPGWTATGVPRPIALAISRGLAADPDARWPDMDSLLAGLSYEPKRRRRRWATAGASIAVVGVMAAGVQSWLERAAARCSGARDQLAGVWDPQRRADVHTAVTGDATPLATDVWTRLEPVLDAYAEQWVEMYTDACEATTVRGEQSAAILDLRMTCLHRANVALEAATRVLSEADPEVVQRAHQIAQGLPPVTRCADVDALQANVEPPLPADATAVDEARSLLARARALDQAGRYDDAQATVAEVTEVLAGVDYGPVQTELALVEGEVLERLGDFEGSVRRTDEALALATRSRQQIEMGNAAMRLMYVIGVHQHETDLALRYRTLAESATAGDALASGDFHSKLASVLNRAGRYAEAETAHRRALELWMTAVGPDHPHISGGRNNIANVLRSQGKYQEAEQEYRAALAGLIAAVGPEHPAVALMHNNLGLVLGDLGRHEQRVPEHRRALALWEAALGPDHVHVATAHNNLGGALYALGDYAGAEAEFRLAMNTYEKAVGPAHPHTARARDNLGAMLGAQGQWEAAEREHRLALEQREVALGDEHPDVALSASNLALALEAQKDFEGALAGYQRALRIEQAALGAEHPSVADAQSNVGGVLQKLGRYEQAEVALRAGLAIAEEALPGDHDELAHARSVLADLLVDRGRAAEAVPLAEQAWARRQRDDTPPERRAETAFVLARATWAADPTRDGYDRARALATRARRAFREAGGAHTEALAAVDAWLREHP